MKKLFYTTAMAALLAAAATSCKPEVKVTGIQLNKSELTLMVGDTETLAAIVLPADAADKSVNWHSSDNLVARVNNNGKITAQNVGTALITATTKDGGKTARCTVTVTKEEDPRDPMYPTTIYRLPYETFLQACNDFAQRNPNVFSTLNQFGFCVRKSMYNQGGDPGGFTEEEAIEATKEFVARNPKYTGVSNPDNLQFRNVTSRTSSNGVIYWYLYTKNQIINGIEVDDTQFAFFIYYKTLTSCDGNHFPNVYVPENFNYDVERAKSKLLGKEIIHGGWGWSDTIVVTTEHLQQVVAKLIIVPKKTDEKIELRVAWQIYLLNYIFEIDVMTGEILRKGSTIID
jgi:transglutaminase/protease-like cytokinesis protein 3